MSRLHILISQLPPKNGNFHPAGQSRSVTNGGVDREREKSWKWRNKGGLEQCSPSHKCWGLHACSLSLTLRKILLRSQLYNLECTPYSLLLSNFLITVKWQTGSRDRGRLAVKWEFKETNWSWRMSSNFHDSLENDKWRVYNIYGGYSDLFCYQPRWSLFGRRDNNH